MSTQFFNIHQESKVAYKKLSSPDLGLGTSHQTHIGLYDDTLIFLFFIFDYVPFNRLLQIFTLFTIPKEC
jgi:hypothetical protein